MANGALSSSDGTDPDIRKKLVAADLIDCIVALPDKLFLNTGIPASLWFLAKDRSGNGHRERTGEVLFIDARQLGIMVTRARRELNEDDIAKIASTYNTWRSLEDFEKYSDEPGFCKAASTSEIADNSYVLTPGRYVGIAEAETDGEPIDEKIERLTKELFAEFERGRALEVEIRERIGGLHE